MDGDEVRLIVPDSPAQWQACRDIFLEYAGTLDVDLGFQDFGGELAGLPGEYAQEAGGQVYLALVGDVVAGCGALRRLVDVDLPNACEMRRLYVQRAFRRFGLGRMLAQALIDAATAMGYSAMFLDTLDEMEAARALYAELGFVEVPPYYYNPLPGAHYLCVPLDGGNTRL